MMRNPRVNDPVLTNNLKAFMEHTRKYISQNPNPGDYYKAVWCRDAAYILKDQFLSGYHAEVLDEIEYIWANQIGKRQDKLIYGRGSPANNFIPLMADQERIKQFSGALPTTIFDGFCEVYGKSPDIDSTALMIYTTCWVLVRMGSEGEQFGGTEGRVDKQKVSKVASSLLPTLLRARDYLLTRDVDGDGLLMQGYNEDWMDTALRKGKVVYSQAVWLMALNNLTFLLRALDQHDDAIKTEQIIQQLVNSIEEKMWSPKQDCYLNVDSETFSEDLSTKILYQDSVLYAVALTEQINKTGNCSDAKFSCEITIPFRYGTSQIRERIDLALRAIKERNWKGIWPLLSDKPLEKTGPRILEAHEYHNFTYWPWITAIELTARSRCGMMKDCCNILSNLLTNRNDFIYYEWLNPETQKGGGAYPFRTGISSFRLAIHEIFSKLHPDSGAVG